MIESEARECADLIERIGVLCARRNDLQKPLDEGGARDINQIEAAQVATDGIAECKEILVSHFLG